jgi:ubiquinone/menaquinone biosynthesis C-methylase UbiE
MTENHIRIREQLVAVFDRTASSYDQIVPFFAAFGEKLVAWAGLSVGQAVLDVGTGRGALIAPALARIGPTGQLTAIDIAREMIARTQADLQRRRIPNVTVAQMDAASIALLAASFDAALSGFAVHILPRPEQAFAEIWRVLKPGGLWAFSVPGPAPSERWRFYPELIGEFQPHVDADKWSLAEPPPPELLLRHAGFVAIESTFAEVHLPVANPEAFWASEMSHGMRGFIEALPVAVQREFKRRLVAHLDQMHRQGGIVLDRAARFYRGRKPSETMKMQEAVRRNP